MEKLLEINAMNAGRARGYRAASKMFGACWKEAAGSH